MILSITILIHLLMCPMLKPNEGSVDRVVRIVLGIILLSLTFLNLTGTAQIIAGVAGGISLITGLVGFCGLYKILGISTIGKK